MVSLYINYNSLLYTLINPRSVSRRIKFYPTTKASNAFGLPHYNVTTFKSGEFIGDVAQGGSCNVKIHHYSPHGITHIEGSKHIISNGQTVDNIPFGVLNNIVYLIDISAEDFDNGLIKVTDIQGKLAQIPENCHILAIKTKYSQEDQHTNFTGKDPLALDPDLGNYLRERNFNLLILDLPSADKENDGGKLLAHRNFMGLQNYETDNRSEITSKQFIIELAYFNSIAEGLYYCQIQPPKVETDAILTDIIFFELSKQ